MPLPLPMKMDPVFTTFFRSARSAFIGKLKDFGKVMNHQNDLKKNLGGGMPVKLDFIPSYHYLRVPIDL